MHCLFLRAGSSTLSAVFNSYYFLEQQFHIYHINCNGTESTIWDCPRNVQISTCSRRNYGAALSCAGK